MTQHLINDLGIYPEILGKNGYVKAHNTNNKSKYFMESWSKPITNEYGTAYIITFNFFDNSELFGEMLDEENPYSWEANLRSIEIDNNLLFSFRLLGTKQNLEYVENFFHKIFVSMDLPNEDYYSSNDCKQHIQDSKKNKAVEDAIRLELGLPARPIEAKLSSIKNKI